MRWDRQESRRRREREKKNGAPSDNDIEFYVRSFDASRRQRAALLRFAAVLRKRGMHRLAERIESQTQSQCLSISEVSKLFALARAALILDDKRLAAKKAGE